MQFSGIKNIHPAVQPSFPSISRILFRVQNENSVPIKQSPPHPPSPQPLAAIILLSVSVHLTPMLGTSWTPLVKSSEGKESACDAGDPGSIPLWGRSPGEGDDYPPQYSCQENPMDEGA